MNFNNLFNLLDTLSDITGAGSPLGSSSPFGQTTPAIGSIFHKDRTSEPPILKMPPLPKSRPVFSPEMQHNPFEEKGWKPDVGIPKPPKPWNEPTWKKPNIKDVMNILRRLSNQKAESKSLQQWDAEWFSIGMLRDADLSLYGNCIGLYRHVINGETMYVGRATELYNGGLRKRLSDYRRDSDSARTHTSGRLIHEHLDEIKTYLLLVGSTPDAIRTTMELEKEFIQLYRPAWNVQYSL